ncbi:hypothetical protein SARC_03994 [Sphaeroforma arctica JP610]|uniref:ZZ-type domain-containing protein n=1 Tax=Sphaeroforma arctica JP610 TaxID=667725 RepID=A0A0L0G3Z3_9EUKA|nr:hypothetical protein SARC_03994 [Sphaeroforma arctica JP610]KNC83770.1 hypothetical protein SARC_03994 [Sphaeroforma arctica JP610]|eukprot:XP_014157672.1 hypothetical protein SARC_03994 [Sphaeroforma arctica JP610]
MNYSSMMSIKVQSDLYGNIKRFNAHSWGHLRTQISRLYNLPSFRAKYADDEGDYVTIVCEADFCEARDSLAKLHDKLRVFVYVDEISHTPKMAQPVVKCVRDSDVGLCAKGDMEGGGLAAGQPIRNSSLKNMNTNSSDVVSASKTETLCFDAQFETAQHAVGVTEKEGSTIASPERNPISATEKHSEASPALCNKGSDIGEDVPIDEERVQVNALLTNMVKSVTMAHVDEIVDDIGRSVQQSVGKLVQQVDTEDLACSMQRLMRGVLNPGLVKKLETPSQSSDNPANPTRGDVAAGVAGNTNRSAAVETTQSNVLSGSAIEGERNVSSFTLNASGSNVAEDLCAHPGVKCDVCDTYILGVRFKCFVCADFDLCATCMATTGHSPDHVLYLIRRPLTHETRSEIKSAEQLSTRRRSCGRRGGRGMCGSVARGGRGRGGRGMGMGMGMCMGMGMGMGPMAARGRGVGIGRGWFGWDKWAPAGAGPLSNTSTDTDAQAFASAVPVTPVPVLGNETLCAVAAEVAAASERGSANTGSTADTGEASDVSAKCTRTKTPLPSRCTRRDRRFRGRRTTSSSQPPKAAKITATPIPKEQSVSEPFAGVQDPQMRPPLPKTPPPVLSTTTPDALPTAIPLVLPSATHPQSLLQPLVQPLTPTQTGTGTLTVTRTSTPTGGSQVEAPRSWRDWDSQWQQFVDRNKENVVKAREEGGVFEADTSTEPIVKESTAAVRELDVRSSRIYPSVDDVVTHNSEHDEVFSAYSTPTAVARGNKPFEKTGEGSDLHDTEATAKPVSGWRLYPSVGEDWSSGADDAWYDETGHAIAGVASPAGDVEDGFEVL